MTPRTVSPGPLDDRRMRRLFLARVHEVPLAERQALYILGALAEVAA